MGLIEAEFALIEVLESGSILDAYAQVENQAACCPPPASSLAVVEPSCCSPITALAALPIAEMACCTPPAKSP